MPMIPCWFPPQAKNSLCNKTITTHCLDSLALQCFVKSLSLQKFFRKFTPWTARQKTIAFWKKWQLSWDLKANRGSSRDTRRRESSWPGTSKWKGTEAEHGQRPEGLKQKVGLQKLWERLEGEERAGLFHSHGTVLNPEDHEKPLNGFKQKSGIWPCLWPCPVRAEGPPLQNTFS